MKLKVILFLLFLFLLINGLVFFISQKNSSQRINVELKEKLNTIQLHYEILLHTHKSTAYALYLGTIEKKIVIDILSHVQDATAKEKEFYRNKLQKTLQPLYDRAKIKDVLQYHFVLPNNESFLRMHKPGKYGDNLKDIRADFKYTNETKKPLRVFSHGRTSHGFRNTFPIFDDNKKYLGALEVSFSSDSFQWYLNNISHIHTHFLVDKDIFNAKAWQRDDLLIKYTQSEENYDFMLALGTTHTKEICIEQNRVKLKPIIADIKAKMLQTKAFSTFVNFNDSVEIISFLPIKNIDNRAVAWLVSYEKSDFIELTLHSMKMVRIITFITSIFLILLIFREIRQKSLKDYEEHIFSLVDIIEKRDSYTAGHTQRVAEYSLLIAKELNLSKVKQDEVYKASILHDIGKISTPDSILLKPGQLNNLEFEIIKEHAQVGYDLLKNVEIYKNIAEIMRYHHERYDGHGYPEGIKGNEIPLLSQIMIVADAFDAMTTNRIYKPRKSVGDAIEELQELSEKQFHPKIVQAAAIALKDIHLEEQITQEPKTKMEKERFSYFYRDQVTGVFNKEYLEVILSYNNSNRLRTTCINTVYLNNFGQYNKNHGWDSGDKLLKQFAKAIISIDGEALVFRVYGDDFVILSKKHCDIKEYIATFEEVLDGTGITAKYKHLDIGESQTLSLSELDELI